jgi:hypothetical protein
MPGSTSNLSIDEQQATVTSAATTSAKRKEDDVAAAAATAHREQEALVAAVAAARKTLDEARVRERAVALAWEKEKTIARHLEQHLAAAQGITIPQDDDDDRSVVVGSNPDAALTAHLHTQAVDLQNIRSVVTIILEPSSPDYKRWHDLVLLTLRRYALKDRILSDVVDPSVYWARLDSIMVIWILGTLSPELHEIIREPMETAHQAWLAIEAQFLGNSESRVLQLDARFRAFKQDDFSIHDYCRRMKGMTDNLRALGETITDRHLVLNLLQGLNKRFNHMKIFIKRSQPFSSFHTIRNDLELEKIELDHSAAQGQASMFYSASSGGRHPPQQLLPPHPSQQKLPCPQVAPPPPTPNPNNDGKGNGKGKEKGKGKNNGSNSPDNNNGNNSRGALAWPSFYNPCTGTNNRSTPYLLHQRTTGLPVAPPSHPCRRLHRTSSRPRPLPGRPGWACGINSHWPTPLAPWP